MRKEVREVALPLAIFNRYSHYFITIGLLHKMERNYGWAGYSIWFDIQLVNLNVI